MLLFIKAIASLLMETEWNGYNNIGEASPPHLNTKDMTRLEKLIGFPVPQEHRKELNDRLNTYENCDRTTLISLLLQHDWEILQTQHVVPPKITKNTMTEYLSEVGGKDSKCNRGNPRSKGNCGNEKRPLSGVVSKGLGDEKRTNG